MGGSSSEDEQGPVSVGTESWNRVLDDLAESLGQDGVTRWFAATQLVEDDGRAITVGVPNLFILNWIEQRYRTFLESSCRRCLGTRTLRLKVDGRLYRQFRRAESEFLNRDADPPEAVSTPTSSSGVAARPAQRLSAEAPLRMGPDAGSALNPAFTLENFVHGPGSLLAHAAALHVVAERSSVYSPLFVCGAGGTGKTHLLQAISIELHRAGRRSIRYLPAESFTNAFVKSVRERTTQEFRSRFYGLEALILDDIQMLGGKPKTQAELLQVIDSITRGGGQVIVAAEVRPQELSGFDPSLVSRLRAGLVCRIEAPDVATRVAILRGEIERRGRSLSTEIIEFLGERQEESVRAMLGTLMRVLILHSVSTEPLTLARVRAELEDQPAIGERRVQLSRVAEVVAIARGLKPVELLSRGRARTVASARQLGIYLARTLTNHSLAEIGAFFGGRHPATVSSTIRSFSDRVARDEGLQREVVELTRRVASR